MELLYRERYELPTKYLWQNKRALMNGLVAILDKSGRLPREKDGLPFQNKELERLLTPLTDFSLDLIKTELDKLNVLWRLVAGYHLFLGKNDVSDWPLETTAILDFVEAKLRGEQEPRGLPRNFDTLNILDDATLDVLIRVGQKAIDIAFPQLSTSLRHSFSLISLAIFLDKFERNPDMLKDVCREAAKKDETVRIVLAYLEFREDLRDEYELDGKRFVSIDYLIQNWAERIAEKERDLENSLQKELKAIQEMLKKGQWLTRLPPVVDKTYQKVLDDMGTELEQLRRVVEKRPQLKESLKRVFRELPDEIVERYLEMRTSTAYLLTFDSLGGSMAHLLDCLVDPTLPPKLEKLGIKTYGNPRPKYVFKNYTANARIGIVPDGWTLRQFQRYLQHDLEKVIEARKMLVPDWPWDEKELKDIEVIMQGFGLSRRNRYPFESELRRPHASPKVIEALADTRKDDDLVAVIGYAQDEMVNLTNAMMDGPITELTGIILSKLQRQKLEEKDEIIKNELLADQQYYSIQDLGWGLFCTDAQQKQAVANKLSALLARYVPQTKPQLLDNIARDYIDTLSAIANIAEADTGVRAATQAYRSRPIKRFTDIRFPEQCRIHQTVRLSVQFTVEPVLVNGEPVEMPKPRPPIEILLTPSPAEAKVRDVDLIVFLSADNFEIDRQWRKLRVPLGRTSSEKIEFSLTGQKLGTQVIEVELFHRAARIGYVVVETEVVDGITGGQDRQVPFEDVNDKKLSDTWQQPTATIIATWQYGQEINYWVLDRNGGSPDDGGSMLEASSREEVAQFWIHLSHMLGDAVSLSDLSKNQTRTIWMSVEGFGRRLGNKLLSDQLRSCSNRWLEGSIIEIATNEQWIPWELIHDGDDFWGNKFILARTPKKPRRRNLPETGETVTRNGSTQMRKAVNVIGGDLRPSIVVDQVKRLSVTFKTKFTAVKEVEQKTPAEVFEAIKDADLIHFTCHGHTDPQPCLQMAVGQSALSCLTPDNMEVLPPIADSIVFANACTSACPTSFQGEACNFGWLFYEKGVAAYIGTLGLVPTGYAVAFAERFYQSLLQGKTVGESLHYAKTSGSEDERENPFWLLYTLYGDPFARKYVAN